MARVWEQTYEVVADSPPPVPWLTYEKAVMTEWRHLLASDPEEPTVHAYLEQHPSLIPGAFSALGRLSSGHGPFMNAVVTKPPLQGLGKKIPDFMWMSRDSSFFNPVLIEIEKPGKPWMTKKGVMAAPLTEALDQLRRWRDWFSVPANQLVFLDHFAVPELFRRRMFQPIFVLVYGRRQSRAEEINQLRVSWTRQDQYLIPYEQLKPDPECADFMCVKNTTGVYRAVSFPATGYLRPPDADSLSMVQGREAAIQRNPLISPERKRFLISRLPYWDDQAQNGGRYFSSQDRE